MVLQGLREGPRWYEEVSTTGSFIGSVQGIPSITLSGTLVKAYPTCIQVGTVGSRTGSDASVTFYEEFTETPYVYVQNIAAGAENTTTPTVHNGSLATTGFYALSTGSPINFNWIAIGKK